MKYKTNIKDYLASVGSISPGSCISLCLFFVFLNWLEIS